MSFILKREGSFDEDDHPSKFKKVTDSFLGFLKKKIGNRSQDEYVQDSFQQDSLLEQQTDILHPDTSSLQEVDSVADQSTRPSNVFSSYYDLLKRQKEQSEHTHLHKPLSPAQPKRMNTRSSSQQGEEDVSLLSKRQRDTSSLDLVPPSKKLKSVDSVRTSLVDINPMERALLINLKERMEMDKYFKSRVKYMGFHNRHVRNSGGTRSFQNTRSPLFLKSVATQNLRNTISQDRKKHGGYFSGEFEYDLDDSTNNYPENQNLLQYKPAVSSLKFSDKPQDKYHPKPANEADVERIINGRVTEPVFKQNKSSLVDNKKDTIGPSIGFKFGDNSSQSENEPNATALENSSQPLVSNNKTTDSKPKFSFGNVQEKKDSDSSQKASSNIDFSFSSKKEISNSSSFTTSSASVNGTNAPTDVHAKPSFSFTAPTTAKPAFSFGAPKIDEIKQDDESQKVSSAASAGDIKSATIPTFFLAESSDDAKKQHKPIGVSFGLDSQSSAQGQPKGQLPSFKGSDSVSSDKTEPNPTFSFGPSGSTSQKDDGTKSKFLFGSAGTASSEKATDIQPKFSFGAGTAANDKSDSAKPTFSFGSSNGSTATEKKDNAKTSFTFNGNTEQAAEPEPKTSFSSSTPSDQKIESKPAFSFTTSSEVKTGESKPAFSFSAPANKETPKPAFSFNDSSEKKEQPTTTKFGSQDNKPSSPPKPVFSFGSTNDQNKPNTDSQKSFSFGKESADNSNKRTFGFDETSTFSKNSASAFTFNVPSNTTKPAFSLGKEKGESFSAPALSFNNNPNANNLGFGSINSNVASAGSSKEPTPSVVNFSSSKGTFGTSTQPSVNNNAFQFGASMANNPSTNRSENNAFPQPQAGFNPSRSATPNFNFTGTSQLDPAAIFGGSGSTPPVPFGQPSVQLNQPQPQTQPNTAFSFGFGNQQQAPSGTPTPSTTPGVKGRALARMRQRRRN